MAELWDFGVFWVYTAQKWRVVPVVSVVGWRFENREKLEKGISRPCGRVFASSFEQTMHLWIPKQFHTFTDTHMNGQDPKTTLMSGRGPCFCVWFGDKKKRK